MIDQARISELKNELGQDDFDEVSTLFLEEISGTLDGLQNGSVPKSCDTFHALRGAAANLGFSRLADLCERSEHDIDLANMDELFRVFAASKAALRSGPANAMTG